MRRYRQQVDTSGETLALAVIRVGVALALLFVPFDRARADEFAPSLYIRTDTDHTTVISPRVRLRAPLSQETNVDFVYAVDVWTSASVDIVASASQPVTEQRDEIDVSIDHAFSDLTLSAGYRYSHEPDYIANGGHAGASLDLANKNTTIAAGLNLSVDQVGRAGDPAFSKMTQTMGVQTSLTQVIDQDTLIQLLYDLSRATGYQASPYRFIAIGGDGLCHGKQSWCVPERAPDARTRNAMAVRLRRALGDRFSLGAGYRLYLDSWDMTSHTGSVSIAWTPSPERSFTLQYRAYTQSAVRQYKSRYDPLQTLGQYFTGDKELSPLSSQRVMLDWEEALRLNSNFNLRFGLSIGPTWYAYRDFRFLKSMTALDSTAWGLLEF